MRPNRALVVVAVVMYGVSFVLPACNGPDRPALGWEAFDLAFRATTGGVTPGSPGWWVAATAWSANPFIWLAIAAALAERPRTAAVLAGGAVVCALPILILFIGAETPFYPGGWVWVGSAVLILVICIRAWNPSPAPSIGVDSPLS